ncbi:MAG TPA: hypothetical protein VIT67_05935, partial [Povalibacter sp.]
DTYQSRRRCLTLRGSQQLIVGLINPRAIRSSDKIAASLKSWHQDLDECLGRWTRQLVGANAQSAEIIRK